MSKLIRRVANPYVAGAYLSVYEGEHPEIGGANFAVGCEKHGILGGAPDEQVAISMSRQPDTFCVECAEEFGKLRRRLR